MKIINFAVVIVLFLAGCQSTPKTSMPTYRMNSPEVSSTPLTVNFSTGIASATEVSLTDEDSSADSSETELFVRASIVAIDGLKIIASSADNGDSTGSVTALYQFSGLKREQADAGNFSQAFSLGYVFSSGNGSYLSLTNEQNNWQQDTGLIDLAWILGYRITPQLITYGGPFVQWGKAEVVNSINITDTTPLEQNSLSDDDYNGHLLGMNLAVEYRFNFGLGLTGEFVASQSKWKNSSVTDNGINIKIDYQF